MPLEALREAAVAAETSVPFGQKFITNALNFYRTRKPDTTERCVVGDLSCSQRFEDVFLSSVEQGSPAPKAFFKALESTVAACAEINKTSKAEAIGVLFSGTTLALLGVTAGVAVCSTSGGTCTGADPGTGCGLFSCLDHNPCS